VPDRSLSRPAKLLDCRALRRPAASKAAHLLTLAPAPIVW
jgi:hypothetical protein